MSNVDYSNWKVADLKTELKSKGLPVSGNKQDLIERLQSALLDEGDDLLDQDDSMTQEAILQAEAELKVTKEPQPAAAAPKINRSAAVAAAAESETAGEAAGDGKENAGAAANTSPVKIVSKPVASSDESADKIKARAERFGGFQSDDAKKNARAARFGIGNGSTGGSNKLGSAPAADMDTLKKRAERFGTNTSNSLKKMEVDEAIKRRQERFGVVDKNEPKPKKISLNAGGNSAVLDEKLKARQQRFGLA